MSTALAVEKLPRFHDRAMASFIIDDVHGQDEESSAAFATLCAWCGEHGLRGECSLIPGYLRASDGSALPLRAEYVRHARAADASGLLDAYVEIMTHDRLYDFAAGRMRDDSPHEGVWLLDESVAMEEYLAYFSGIAACAAEYGLKPNGLTIPGCGCPDCVARKKARRILQGGASYLNSGVAQALLRLAKDGALATPIAGTFIGATRSGPADAVVLAEDGAHAVYDVPPGVSGDHLARWENDPRLIDVDAYVTEDGAGGRLAELIALGSRTLVYYGHWQGLRPDRGVGWPGFQEVARRLARHHGERIEWLRPTAIAAYTHVYRHTELRPDPAGRPGFSLAIPFTAPSPLSLRVRGSATARLRAPDGAVIEPWRRFPGEACAIFDVAPRTGRYEILA